MRATRAAFGVLVLVLLAGSVQAEGLFGERPEPGQMPSRFVRFDAADLGLAYFHGLSPYPCAGGVIAKAMCQLGRFRIGAAAVELWADPMDRIGPVMEHMVAPVYAGYDIWHSPKKTWFFYGAVPDIHAEAGVSFYPMVTLKAALACDVDYYGLGLRIEGGYYAVPRNDGGHLYAALQVRVLTFGIGF